MNDSLVDVLFGLFMGTLLGGSLMFCFLAGSNAAWRAEAIENNVAEWRIDSKTGEESFVWLNPNAKGEK